MAFDREVMTTDDLPRPVLTVAHRGASGQAPENTLSAVRRAVALGADLVEVDVQRTRDGALVLMHDTSLERTSDVRWRRGRRAVAVQDLSLAQLRRLDVGSWFDAAYAGERVPTLSETIEAVRGTRSGLLLELKAPHLHPGIVADLADLLTQEHALVDNGRITVQSFDVAAVKELATRLPAVRIGVLGRPPRAHLPALASWAHQVNPRLRGTDAAYVAAVQEAGLQCLVWTVNRTVAMRRALAFGVDGVITNHPEVLHQVRAEVPAR